MSDTEDDYDPCEDLPNLEFDPTKCLFTGCGEKRGSGCPQNKKFCNNHCYYLDCMIHSYTYFKIMNIPIPEDVRIRKKDIEEQKKYRKNSFLIDLDHKSEIEPKKYSQLSFLIDLDHKGEITSEALLEAFEEYDKQMSQYKDDQIKAIEELEIAKKDLKIALDDLRRGTPPEEFQRAKEKIVKYCNKLSEIEIAINDLVMLQVYNRVHVKD